MSAATRTANAIKSQRLAALIAAAARIARSRSELFEQRGQHGSSRYYLSRAIDLQHRAARQYAYTRKLMRIE